MIVDLYTRMCSLNITTAQLALMGSCYANGGVNPVSKKRVVKEENVPPILAEMCMSGLYDSTGDWMYKAGLPAKSGVGGGLVAVSPGQDGPGGLLAAPGPGGEHRQGAGSSSIHHQGIEFEPFPGVDSGMRRVNPRSQDPKGFPRVYCIPAFTFSGKLIPYFYGF